MGAYHSVLVAASRHSLLVLSSFSLFFVFFPLLGLDAHAHTLSCACACLCMVLPMGRANCFALLCQYVCFVAKNEGFVCGLLPLLIEVCGSWRACTAVCKTRIYFLKTLLFLVFCPFWMLF